MEAIIVVLRNVFYKLLGDSRAAVATAEFEKIIHPCRYSTLPIHARVLVKSFVLNAYECVYHILRYLAIRYVLASVPPVYLLLGKLYGFADPVFAICKFIIIKFSRRAASDAEEQAFVYAFFYIPFHVNGKNEPRHSQRHGSDKQDHRKYL